MPQSCGSKKICYPHYFLDTQYRNDPFVKKILIPKMKQVLLVFCDHLGPPDRPCDFLIALGTGIRIMSLTKLHIFIFILIRYNMDTDLIITGFCRIWEANSYFLSLKCNEASLTLIQILVQLLFFEFISFMIQLFFFIILKHEYLPWDWNPDLALSVYSIPDPVGICRKTLYFFLY